MVLKVQETTKGHLIKYSQNRNFGLVGLCSRGPSVSRNLAVVRVSAMDTFTHWVRSICIYSRQCSISRNDFVSLQDNREGAASYTHLGAQIKCENG